MYFILLIRFLHFHKTSIHLYLKINSPADSGTCWNHPKRSKRLSSKPRLYFRQAKSVFSAFTLTRDLCPRMFFCLIVVVMPPNPKAPDNRTQGELILQKEICSRKQNNKKKIHTTVNTSKNECSAINNTFLNKAQKNA